MTRAPRINLGLLVAAAILGLLPTIALLPLGGLYLYERGLILPYAVGSVAIAGLAALLARTSLGRARNDADELRAAGALPGPTEAGGGSDDGGYRGRELEAWKAVRRLAEKTDPASIVDRRAILDLGIATLDEVARVLHPERDDALWQFTAPEVLAIVERTSARLGQLVASRVPFGERLTMAQLLSIYRWRGVVRIAERAYDVWRLARLVNPAAAAAGEVRDRLSRAAINWGREKIARRLVVAYVEEVGRAGIELYGGRLRPHAKGEAPVTTDSADPAA